MTSTDATTIAGINAMPVEELAAQLRSCCGSPAWIDAMIARRPWRSMDALLQASDDAWRSIGPDKWVEAFSHHPRLGETSAATPQDERSQGWSRGEQGALLDAGTSLRTTLAAANAAYENQFGYICIICAAGKDAEELLAITRARLGNAPEIELRIAAEEQRKIIRLRLRRLLSPDAGSR